MNHVVRLVMGGDVMLGRLVADHIAAFGPDYPLGGVASTLRGADLALVNLECAITESSRPWSGAPKPFYFGAPPAAAEGLAHAGIDVVTLANNHALDFDVAGLADTMRLLRAQGIACAGAGRDLTEAMAPVVFERGGLRLGLVAYCDHQADFAARADAPGTAYLDLEEEAGVRERLRADADRLRALGVDWPVLSLHWGPNMVERPSARFRRIAHASVDAGFRLLFGHSAHVFQGIEVYRGAPILYAAGDLVDDYAVDPELRNDRQVLFEVELVGGSVRRMGLRPVLIGRCRVVPAARSDFEAVVERATKLCAELGTRVRREGSQVWVEAGPGPAAGAGRPA